MENKKTPEGLPVITKKIYKAFINEFNRDFNMEGGDNYLEKRLGEIYSENPLLYRLINIFADRFPQYGNLDKKAAISMTSGYELLKSQAGNNIADEMWFPSICVVDDISFVVPPELIKLLGWEDGDGLEGEIKKDSFILKRIKRTPK